MPFSKILVAYDGSKASKKALDKAKKLAEENPEASLDVLHVMQFPTLLVGEAMINAPVNMKKEYYDMSDAIIDEAQAALADLANPHQVVIREGQPAKSVLDYADENGSDLIVIGSRGLGGIREFVLGSVSHNVVQHARIPVLIVK